MSCPAECGECRRCMAHREELAGRVALVPRAKRPAWWRPKPGTARALATVGHGEDKMRQRRRAS